VAPILLAKALGVYRRERVVAPASRWISRSMGARVDLADRDVLPDVMEHPRPLR
jgi:hypothetical protein